MCSGRNRETDDARRSHVREAWWDSELDGEAAERLVSRQGGVGYRGKDKGDNKVLTLGQAGLR